MPLRVKNIAAGFTDATGFHPIRRSPDYDADRAGDDYGAAKDATGLKYRRGRKPVTKARKRKPATKARTKRKAAPKRKRTATLSKARRKNPISTQWSTAKVRRTPGGDIQVMLFPGKARTTRRRRVAVRRRRRTSR